MDYKLKIGGSVIEGTSPNGRVCKDLAKHMYEALEDDWGMFLRECELAMRKLGKKKSVKLKSKPLEITITRA